MRIVLLAALALGFVSCESEPQVPVVDETLDEKYEKVRESFEATSNAPNDIDTTGIAEFFDAYGAAAASSDMQALGELFDFRLFYAAIESHGLVPAKLSDVDRVAPLLEQALLPRLVDPLLGIHFTRTDIHRVQAINQSEAVVVYARHWQTDGVPTKKRWWLDRSNGDWRAYDFEHLEISMRQSVLMGIGLTMGEEDDPSIPAFGQLMEGVELGMSGLAEQGLASLSQLDGSGLPPVIEAMRLMLIGLLLSDMGEHEAALARAEEVVTVNPDVPMVHLVFATSYIGLGQYEQALESANRYAELLGEDADYFVEAGDAYLGMGMTDEAIAAYEQGVMDDPQSGFSVWGLLRSLPPARQVEAREAYAGLEDVDIWFDGFAELSAREARWTDLARLIELQREVMPEDENLTFYVEVLRTKELPAADSGQPD